MSDSKLQQRYEFCWSKNKLQELEEAIFSEKAKRSIVETCNNKGVNFKFIPPRAPHFGGLWEAAVKSAKHLLLKNVFTADLTYEELETVIVEIEAIHKHVHKQPAAEEEEENSPDERQTKRSKKSAMSSLTMALVVMLLLLPLVAAQSINVTQLASKPGIFVERIGKSQLAITYWTLIVYYNLQPYWKDMSTFSIGTTKIGHLYKQFPETEACTSLYQHFKHIEDRGSLS